MIRTPKIKLIQDKRREVAEELSKLLARARELEKEAQDLDTA